MFRLTKQTDLAIQLMVCLASEPGPATTAREIAGRVRSSIPLVSKALKLLARSDLLESHRGKNGGYSLKRSADKITVAELVEATEGPIALTECATMASNCEQETWCPVSSNMKVINRAIYQALDHITLAQMATPSNPELLQTLNGATPRS